MTEPEFDNEGYPTEETLKAIREWPSNDHAGLLKFCLAAWEVKEYFLPVGDSWRVSTGGWSGNEAIIEAMQANIAFWHQYWKQSTRGGHYVFEPVY